MGIRDTASSSLRGIKKDYRALGEVVKDSGMQGIFHQSFWSKGRGLKWPVRSGESTSGFGTGDTARAEDT